MPSDEPPLLLARGGGRRRRRRCPGKNKHHTAPEVASVSSLPEGAAEPNTTARRSASTRSATACTEEDGPVAAGAAGAGAIDSGDKETPCQRTPNAVCSTCASEVRGNGTAGSAGARRRRRRECRSHHGPRRWPPKQASASEEGKAPATTATTLCMNPYVRCVRLWNTVPKIKSLKELLALPLHACPTEADTPCLRPSGGGLPMTPITRARSAQELCSVRPDSSGQTPRVEGIWVHPHPQRQGNASPLLSFTVDGVATPNTFATVRRHESQALVASANAHHGEPTTHHKPPQGDGRAEEVGAELSVVDMRLPTSTVEVVAATETQREQQLESASRTGGPCSDAGGGRESYGGGVVPIPDIRQTGVNARIVSPHSLALSGGGSGDPPQALPSSAPTSTPSQLRSRARKGETPSSSSSSSSASRERTTGKRVVLLRPVAKIEESPYHYITRNYVGGTFLYYSSSESKQYFLKLCYKVVEQVTPILERETVHPEKGLFPTLLAPAVVLGDVHGSFGDLFFFLQEMIPFHDFNLSPANLLCLGDYVDRGPFSLECVILLLALKIMNADRIVLLRGNHEDRVVCGDVHTYGQGCFAAQCQTVFGYQAGMHLFKAVTALFRYLPLACELVVPYAPNRREPFAAAATTTTTGNGSRSSGSSAAAAADSFCSSRVHENLYVRQACVPLHPWTPAPQSPSHTECEPSVTASGEDRSQCSASKASSSCLSSYSSSASSPSSPSSASTTSLSEDRAARSRHGRDCRCAACCSLPATRGLPSEARAGGGGHHALRRRTHEERILCAHGGIPRFFGPPQHDDALSFLRSPLFPRLLTLFPFSSAAVSDPECAPDYYHRHLLERLKRQYLPRPSCGCLCDGCVEAEQREGDSDSVPLTARTAQPGGGSCSSCSGALPGGGSAVAGCGRHRDCVCAGPLPAERGAARGGLGEEPLVEGARRPTLEEHLHRGWYVALDLLWSDPTPTEEPSGQPTAARSADEKEDPPVCRTNEWGFGVNTRGGNVISYSAKAVDTFLSAYGYAVLVRAHQEKTHGLRWSKNKRVLTVFSSSNYLGHGNGAGCVVVSADGEIQMIEKLSDTHP